jgi:hypothetical protein
MRTLNNTDIRGFGIHEAALNPAIWLVAPPSRRGNLNLSPEPGDLFRSEAAESEPIRQEPQGSESSNDDFPFSALIRLVRQMRK